MPRDVLASPEKVYLRLAQEVCRVGYFEWDTISNKVNISAEVYQMFGYVQNQEGATLTNIIQEYVHPDYQASLQAAAQKIIEDSNSGKPLELKILGFDGSEYWVRAKAQKAGGKVIGVLQDITEQKRNERIMELKDAVLEINHAVTDKTNINDFFRIILEKIFGFIKNADLGTVLILDEQNNLKIAASLGYNQEKAKDFNIRLKESFIWHQSAGKLEKTVIINDVHSLVQAGFPQMLENKKGYTIKSTISSPIFLEDKLYGLLNIDSRIPAAFDQAEWEIMEYGRHQIAIAVSKHKLYEETIYLSRHDKLTGIYNRRYFEELLFNHIDQAARYKNVFTFAVFDLNNLKVINDTYGHLAGDEVIRHFARTLRKLCRSSDIFARFGGDEFVAVFPETLPDGLKSKFEEVIRQFKAVPLIFEGTPLTCSFSYGLASYPLEGASYDELVKVADKRMYEHKRKASQKVKDTAL